MSHEIKYVKYKLKYLKLLLSSELEQQGGGLIKFPTKTNQANQVNQASEINVGDKLMIVRFGMWKTQNNLNENSNLSNFHNITGTVESVGDDKIILSVE